MNWKSIVQPIYDETLRPHLPIWGTAHTRANIPVPADANDPIAPRILDFNKNDPEYKREYLEAIRKHVNEGDDVGIIGGGRGISSVVALRRGATVTAYEAAQEMVSIAEKTIDWQGFSDEFELVHGVVGEPIEVYGDRLGKSIPPGEIDHDVLILDCEGSEANIIRQLKSIPDILIVETHPGRGVSSQKTIDAMEASGYVIIHQLAVNDTKFIVVARRFD
jgi:tRNA A58 N-methylase Trm61